jgi:methyl-accepting chemotaxis protein
MGKIKLGVRGKLLLVTLGALSVIALGALVALGTAWQRLGAEVPHEVSDSQKMAKIQETFRIQVQEWKNTLLRGKDPKALNKYWASFEEAEQIVQSGARALAAGVKSAEGRTLLEQFAAEHEKLGKAYRKGLESLKAAGYDPVAGDVAVKGIDREPTEILGKSSLLLGKLADEAVIRGATQARQVIGVSVGAILVALLLVFALLPLWIMRKVVQPVMLARDALAKVAAGDLSGSIASGSSDEIGQMLDAMQRMQARLQLFAAAQAEMARQHDEGCIDHQLPADSFPGAYGAMAKQVNDLVKSHIGVQLKIVDVVKRYAQGDLSKDMDRLPGKKAQITEAVDGVKASLTAVNGTIKTLVSAAVTGDFTVRGDASKYQYEFREMVEGLNRLMQLSDTGLNEVVRVLGALARGDLTEKITNGYQGTFGRLKDDSNATVAQLSQIIGQIRDASESIDTASREIAAGNTDLSRRTEEQASSLEETASSMEELTATVKQNAENAKQANQLAAGAAAVAVKGGAVVGEVVGTMSSINESSRKIVDIISVIDGIAFQTNILALNAAVEAARAGEQGRGFAVVASEVRNLAQRSAAAAKEIKTLIGDSVDKVEEGARLVDAAGKTMEEIVQAVKRVTDIMTEISAASQEQSAGIEQVNQAITQMDQATQQNAALVEEAAAAAESMKDQAGSLSQAVSVFVVGGAATSGGGKPVGVKLAA